MSDSQDEEARRIIELFVSHYEPWMDGTDEAGRYWHLDNRKMSSFARVTYGDLRRARAFLAKISKQVASGMEAAECPKCSARSGDDWQQCAGACPMVGSPHFTPLTNAPEVSA